MRFVVALVVLVLSLSTGVARAGIERLAPLSEAPFGTDRFALVVGNSDYVEVTDLPNALNDARAVGETLRRKGYDVVLAQDVSRREMNEAVTRFLAMITPGAETFFYYAGHGVELDGANYLLPTDIPQLTSNEDRLLRTEGINLSSLLFDFQSRAARVTLAVLDACRDNPFKKDGTRSLGSTRGLARVDPPQGSFVIYAAGAGETALDSLGPSDDDPNGVFTRELLQVMNQDGLELREMVRTLRQDVRQAALSAGGHSQTPSYYDQLLGDFYFAPAKADAAPDVAPRQSVPEAPVALSVCTLLVDPDALGDDILMRDLSTAIAACERAVAGGTDDGAMAERLEIVREQEAFRIALLSASPAVASAYLRRYPQGRFIADVSRHLATLRPLPDGARGGSATTLGTPSVQTARNQNPAAPLSGAAPLEAAIDLAPDTPGASPPGEDAPDEGSLDRETVRALQAELTRVGCEPGAIDGLWGGRSSGALERFAEEAGLALKPEPSLAALDALKKARSRVCPLSCGAREEIRNGACVVRSCPSEQRMNSKGVCYTPRVASTKRAQPESKPAATPSKTTTRKTPSRTAPRKAAPRKSTPRKSTPPKAAAARPSASSKCFIFNGARVCE